MLREKSRIRGRLTVVVFGPDGQIKRRNPSFWQRLTGRPGSPMVAINHNIVTNDGDAMVADLCAQTPALTKLANASGFIAVGTGWTGSTPKANTWVNTISGSPEALDATYPVLKGTFGNADDNVTIYRATFEAGDLNVTGIDEAVLSNANTDGGGQALAYAQITPEINVTSADTLQVTWEITFLGA